MLTDGEFKIDRPPVSADAVNDEFNGTTLDAKWTVVNRSSGTVSLTAAGGNGYDLTTRPGWLLMQPDTGGYVQLRQDYTLPDGSSVVACVAPCVSVNGQSGITDNQLDCGIAVSDDSGAWHNGNYATVHFDAEVDGFRIYGGGGLGGDGSIVSGNGRSVPTADTGNMLIARRLYFRILRSSLDYYTMFSCDGEIWLPYKKITLPAAADTLWVFGQVDDAIPDPTPIVGFDWVRIGGSGVDPW